VALYGIELRKWSPIEPRASAVRMLRIRVHYDDGRSVRFVPQAGEELLSRDDVDRVVGLLRNGSNALEWGLAAKRESDTSSD
jgi:hypothetical protein